LNRESGIDTIALSTELGFLRGADRITLVKDNMLKFAEDATHKPLTMILDCAMGNKEMKEAADEMKKVMPKVGVPVYRTMARLITSVSKVAEYEMFLQKVK